MQPVNMPLLNKHKFALQIYLVVHLNLENICINTWNWKDWEYDLLSKAGENSY